MPTTTTTCDGNLGPAGATTWRLAYNWKSRGVLQVGAASPHIEAYLTPRTAEQIKLLDAEWFFLFE
jgi:hypothetical protein